MFKYSIIVFLGELNMEISRSVQDELAKRDEIILALEMLVVDQASRLLAFEAILCNSGKINHVSEEDLVRYIDKESGRFKNYLEGEGLVGFKDRANRVAKDFLYKSK
tara:strand:+ start:963 stop:1283 length:321 start_codon:yes stop_codon:yes gene_type:complete